MVKNWQLQPILKVTGFLKFLKSNLQFNFSFNFHFRSTTAVIWVKALYLWRQSYEASMKEIYDCRVAHDLKIPHIMTLDS